MSEPTTISIAIPAWGSAPYLLDALKTIDRQHATGVEVVVSVDPGSPDRMATLKLLNEHRGLAGFRLVEPSKPLSMAEHYEWCLRQLGGRYVTILGADDGLLPWGLQLVHQILDHNPEIDALCFRRAYYFWPGVDAQYGRKCVHVALRPEMRVVQTDALMEQVLSGKIQHFDFPQIYTNNFVRNDVIANIRAASGGRVYHEQNPDVYSGIAVAHFARHVVRCEIPAFWTGTSPSSMGLRQTAANEGDELAQHVVHEQFVSKSEASGHGVAAEIGRDVWLAARASSTYCASAYVQFRRATNTALTDGEMRDVVRAAMAGALATSPPWSRLRETSVSARARRQRLRMSVRKKAGEWNLRYRSLALLALQLSVASVATQFALRVRVRVQKFAGHETTLNVERGGQVVLARLQDANFYIAQSPIEASARRAIRSIGGLNE